MIFQGQEALEGGWFSDDDPLDWLRADDFHGIARLYQDLIDLRLNRGGVTRGLTGSGLNVFHVDEDAKVIAFQRWAEHGPGDDVVVVANFHRDVRERYRIGWPAGGLWKLRFNSDASAYSAAFGDFPTFDVEPFTEDEDGLAFHTDLSIGPQPAHLLSGRLRRGSGRLSAARGRSVQARRAGAARGRGAWAQRVPVARPSRGVASSPWRIAAARPSAQRPRRSHTAVRELLRTRFRSASENGVMRDPSRTGSHPARQEPAARQEPGRDTCDPRPADAAAPGPARHTAIPPGRGRDHAPSR